MHALLESQRRMLGAWIDACSARPALHAHQLLALRRDEALAAGACDISAYQRAGGGLELARSVRLDRHAGRLRIALTVGDEYDAQAALADYRAALAPLGGAADVEAAPWAERAGVAGTQLVNALHNLLLQHTSIPAPVDHAAAARAAWQTLCVADPPGAHAARHAPQRLARVAWRIPWQDGALLTSWLAALPPAPDDDGLRCVEPLAALSDLQALWQQSWGAAATDAGLAWDSTSAGVEQALAPWRALAEPGAQPTATAQALAQVATRMLEAAAGASDVADVHRRLLAARLPAALAAAPQYVRIAELEQRQAIWPQGLLAAHAAQLRAGLRQAQTDTEVELLACHAQACLAIEADWQSLLYAVALAPLRAAAMVAICGPEAEPGLHQAVAVAHGLLGFGPRALLELPMMSAFVSGNLALALAQPARAIGAWRGEAGFEALRPLAAWAELAALQGAPPELGSGALVRTLRRLLDNVGAGEPPPAGAEIRRWGRPLSPAAWGLWDDTLRPPLPGWAG